MATILQSQLLALKTQIERQVNWGESAAWSNYDFEKLSEQISQKTGVTLSVSTLKRIFGKVNYKSEPSLTTLNALAQFINYNDWRAFTLATTEITGLNPIKTEPADPPTKAPANPNRRYWLFTLLTLVSVGLLSFFFLSGRSTHNPDDFSFHSTTMLTEGLPNSVVFDIDASKANARDSVFICQTWDTRRKVLINKNDKHHSAIYYYPGYFRAKLMIGADILKEHDIQIKTKGWLGLVEADWGIEPLYFKQSQIWTPNMVTITKALLDQYNLPLSPSPPKIRLYNQQDIRGIKTDNFIFQTELKNEYAEGANSCQRLEVLLQAKDDIMIVPLARKGCIGDIYVAAYGYYAQSSQEDLSGFGCNPNEWTTLKVVCKHGLMTFYLNNRPIYKAQMTHKATEIVGVQYRFNGPAAVRNTWLAGATGKIVF